MAALTAIEIFEELTEVVDPERAPLTLSDLGVVTQRGVVVQFGRNRPFLSVTVTPTMPHCGMVSLIVLSIHFKLLAALPQYHTWKVRIVIPDEAHHEAPSVQRLANDKERVAAALENPTIASELMRLTRVG